MKEDKRVPELRFPEFSGEWEKNILGNILEFKNGLNKGKEFFGYGTPIINYMDVNKNKHLLGKDIEGKVNVNESELERYKVILGDVFFTRTSEVLEEIGLASVILENVDSCVYSGFVIRGRNITNKINPIFSGYLYNTENVRKEIIRKSSKTTRALTNSKLLSEVTVHYPSLSEQQKIGNFFFCIDKKLELQQERIDILKEYKKGMMQRIFSQEIRFKGENGENYPDWEEKKLGEVAEIYSGGTPSTQNKEFWNGDILWVTPTDVTSNDKYLYDTEKKITNLGLKKSSAKLLPINSILMTSRATVGEVVINKVEASTNQGFKSFVVSDENNHEFLYYRLITLKNKFKRMANGSTFLEISMRDTKNIKAYLPSLPEQEKIAEFLSAIDKKIELEEERLEEYKKFKKGLMQRMFV